MTKILFVSDPHYGLKSSGFDRTEEIHSVMKDVVGLAASEHVDFFICGGDLGHTPNPSSSIHAMWVELFNRLEGENIESFFMLGNHDTIHREGAAYGSLEPLFRLDYPFVRAIVRPQLIRRNDTRLLFFPYFSPANNDKRTIDETNEATLSDYESEINAAPGQVLAFAHLNIAGAAVNDDFILRPVKAALPNRLVDLPLGGIFCGHIHKPQRVGKNIVIVGSPICTDFGDMTEKRVLIIEGGRGKPWTVCSRKTTATPLVLLEWDLVDCPETDLSFDPESVRGAGVKVKLRMTEDQTGTVDLDGLRRRLEDVAAFVRPITPVIVRRRTEAPVVVRSGMTDVEAVRAWLADRKPTNREAIEAAALETMEAATGAER